MIPSLASYAGGISPVSDVRHPRATSYRSEGARGPARLMAAALRHGELGALLISTGHDWYVKYTYYWVYDSQQSLAIGAMRSLP